MPLPNAPSPVDEPRADVPADQGAGDPDAPPEGHEEFAKHLDYAMAHHPHLSKVPGMCQKYGMDDADAGAVPDGGAPDAGGDVLRNQRRKPADINGAANGDVQKTKYQRDIDQIRADLDKERQQLAIERQNQRIQRYQMTLQEMTNEYELDVPTELEDCAGLDDKGFEKHVERIKRCYARTPVGGDLPFDAIGGDATPGAIDLNDPAVGAKCHKYMRDNPEFTQKHGERAFMEAAKALKIIPA